ncbi:hypothetical protein ColTof3_03577 [Colletotrichum tofieldiae]|nr:hypothetical protein ColTof3_03577 [Colletotrichum tofieldiae]
MLPHRNFLAALLAVSSLTDKTVVLGATIPREHLPSVASENNAVNPLQVNENSDLEPRTWDYLGKDARRRVTVALELAYTVHQAIGFDLVVKDCMKWKAGEADNDDKRGCWQGAIGAVLTVGALTDASVVIWGTIKEHNAVNAWNPPGWRQLFEMTRWGGGGAPNNIHKRELTERKEEALRKMSLAFGSEIRHVGWHEDQESHIAKRDGKPQMVPVLGGNIAGVDIHFTSLGPDETGKHHYKFGYGMGNETDNTLTKRNAKDYLSGVYFNKGGLNFWAQPEPAYIGFSRASKEVWLDTDEEFEWIYEQVKCTLNDYLISDPLHATGMYFQVYNNMDSETLSAGAIAPFDEHGTSAITQMQELRGGLDVDGLCMRKLDMHSDKGLKA